MQGALCSLLFVVVVFQDTYTYAEDHNSVGLENNKSLVRSRARPIFFPRIDDSNCDRSHSSLTAVHCFDDKYVGKQPMAWKKYCAQVLVKKLQESMDRCTDHRDITERLLKTALNTIQLISRGHVFIHLCTLYDMINPFTL